MNRFAAILTAVAVAAGSVGVVAVHSVGATGKTEKTDKMEKSGSKTTDKMTSKTATGTVKSASGDSIVVAGKDKGKDAEWTFALDDKTKVKKANAKDATAKDLAAGDSVVVRYMDHDGKMTASSVTVRAPKKEGGPAKTSKPAEKKQ